MAGRGCVGCSAHGQCDLSGGANDLQEYLLEPFCSAGLQEREGHTEFHFTGHLIHSQHTQCRVTNREDVSVNSDLPPEKEDVVGRGAGLSHRA